jgi:GxxExxY protein
MPTYPQNTIELMIEDTAKSLLVTIKEKANEVYRLLGRGYSESVYQRALSVEFQTVGIPHDLEVTMSVPYKGHVVGQVRSDIILRGRIPVIIETKATAAALKPEERWQLSRYLKLQEIYLGALINFSQVGTATAPQVEFFLYTDNEFYIYNLETGLSTVMT